jgi:hypothetical protein
MNCGGIRFSETGIYERFLWQQLSFSRKADTLPSNIASSSDRAALRVMTDLQAEKIVGLLTEIRDLTKQRNELAAQTRDAYQQQIEVVSRRQADALAEMQARRADERKRLYVSALLVLVCLVIFAIGIVMIMTRP